LDCDGIAQVKLTDDCYPNGIMLCGVHTMQRDSGSPVKLKKPRWPASGHLANLAEGKLVYV
jgi:hypothetical protein